MKSLLESPTSSQKEDKIEAYECASWKRKKEREKKRKIGKNTIMEMAWNSQVHFLWRALYTP